MPRFLSWCIGLLFGVAWVAVRRLFQATGQGCVVAVAEVPYMR